MLKNYLKIALRNLNKQKVYSIITLSGLVLGLGTFIIFAMLNDFISNFDTFHVKGERIYSVVQVLPGGLDGDQHSAITPAPLVPALMNEFPEIESASRYFLPGRQIVKYNDKVFYENFIRFVDPDFLSIFSFRMRVGDAETALVKPNSVVITEATAQKYFGSENPIGKSLTVGNKFDALVTGIIENVPKNSSLKFDFLVSMNTANTLYDWTDNWKLNKNASFLLLSRGIERKHFQGKLELLIDKYYAVSPNSPKSFYLHPLPDFFLQSRGIANNWNSGGANFTVLWIVAVLLLMIASINFMNLSTARYLTRANEVGMRKVIGADRFRLIKQFLGESILMTLIALPAAILFFVLVRPAFITYVDNSVNLSLNNPNVLILTFIVTIITGILAGSYPAFYLSAFKPVQVLKGKIQTGKKGGRLRKILVVVQFSFSIILIVMTLVSMKQTNHNSKLDLGFDRSQIIAVEIGGEARDNLDILKKELVGHKDILAVSASVGLPIEWDTKQKVLFEGAGEEESLTMNVYGIDVDFIELLDLKIQKGRSFSQQYNDSENLVLNETAVQQLQWENPIGKKLTIGDKKGTVIGIAKDFHFKSIYFDNISPTVLRLAPNDLHYLLVKYSAREKRADVIEFIESKWNGLTPDLPFEPMTLDYYFEDIYSGDKTAEMTGTIGLMAIFLSCMGLLGLSSFAVERRIKEIGIRKVLGASIIGIIRMLTNKFMKLVLVANLIAIPIAYFIMDSMTRFLYSYPVDIGAGIFIFTTGITLLIAFITVSSQTLKAAHSNPVDSLKYE